MTTTNIDTSNIFFNICFYIDRFLSVIFLLCIKLFIYIRVNYKFCLLCLHQIAGVVLLAKSLQAVSLTFQNLARFVL
ncbi:hypothetical protein Hanom_Chr00s000004g01608691 [Helianthus anomalus]